MLHFLMADAAKAGKCIVCDACSDDDNSCDMEECDIEENEDGADGDLKPAARRDGGIGNASNTQSRSRSSSRTRSRSSSDVDFTQFTLE